MNTPTDNERIVKSAVLFIDGALQTGARHHNCFTDAQMMGEKHACAEQGFMTSRGRFVTRRQAAEIAYRAGQVSERMDRLMSEDIWPTDADLPKDEPTHPTDNGAQRPDGYASSDDMLRWKRGVYRLTANPPSLYRDMGGARARILDSDPDLVLVEKAEAEQTIATLRAQLDEAVEAYESYVALLNAELNELAGLAAVHGWVSTRFEAGKKARERIAAILTRHAEKGET